MEPSIQIFLQEQFGDLHSKVIPLAGDASNRRYFRVVRPPESWVLMVWEPFKKDDYPFLSVLYHFAKNKIKVPQVAAMDEKRGLVLLEDLGDLTLERKFWESQNPESALGWYRQAIAELIKIHFAATHDRSPCTAFQMMFDTEKLRWEMNYGLENLILGVCKHQMDEPQKKAMVDLFTDICERLHHEPKWIAHRDYHSRNLMIKLDEVRVIDFQDARLGPLQYDLVSLLRDSYVQMPEAMENALISDYLDQAKEHLPKDLSRTHFLEIYELQTVQRCFKACGSFASFYNQRKDTRYLKYISGTLRRVMKSLVQFPEYKLMADLLIDSGSLERNYEHL